MTVALTGKIREGRGKGPNRRLRNQGLLPAVMYGKEGSLSLAVNPKELRKLVDQAGINTLIELKIDGDSKDKRTVLIKDHQEHPLKPGWLHADFQEVDLTKKIRVRVPIHLVGNSPGEKMGGIVELLLQDVEIRCLPSKIPEAIEVQMGEVQLNQVVHVSDLVVPPDVEIVEHGGDAVVSVHEVKVHEEKAATAEEGAVEGEAAEAPAAGEKEESKES